MLVFSTIYSMRLLTLIILWILGHCYLVAQLYLLLGSVPRYYLGLNEKVKIKSCFLMCCRTSCSKKHLFIMLRNRFLSHRPRGGWLTYILKHRRKLGKDCPDWWVQLLDTLGNLGLEILPCHRADRVYSLAAVFSGCWSLPGLGWALDEGHMDMGCGPKDREAGNGTSDHESCGLWNSPWRGTGNKT